ncbi:unnamed protein product [Arctia plantaginis]|uniref:Zinc finger PHD-type domain-containing protein n=1 Tax=Arctia plantaginis TaxID=874455 RepID=A0A8S1ATY9_ARCPL|nr:unnamed protein product [Arctia plantaginis]
MKRCAAECTIDLNTEDYMECTRCRDAYHYVCLNLSPTEVASLDQDIKRSWSCPRCFSKQPKGGNIDLPVRPSTPTSTADVTFNVTRRKVQQRPESLQMTTQHSDFVLRTELRELIREEMRNVVKECITDLNITLKENLQAMREQISSFKDSLNFMSDQYDNLHKTVEECRTNLISLSKENESLRSDNIKLSNKLSLLDQDFSQQHASSITESNKQGFTHYGILANTKASPPSDLANTRRHPSRDLANTRHHPSRDLASKTR